MGHVMWLVGHIDDPTLDESHKWEGGGPARIGRSLRQRAEL
jgi:hypothetical protein